MARKKPKGKNAAFEVFNVHYEDGSIRSNRRVPNELLDQSLGGNILDLARNAIQDQDNEIARHANGRRARIKSIVQV
jgi:hypothetical protein